MSSAHVTRARIGPRSAGIAMTPEEFDDLREGEWNPDFRYELIYGVLVVSPPAACAERSPNEELGYLLRLYKDTHPCGAALDDTLPEHTVLSTPNRRRCDRAIWAGLGRQPREETDLPTIIVEFVSRSKSDKIRDDEVKREEYRLAGVLEYWIFDRSRRHMTVAKFGLGETMERVIRGEGSYETDLLPGFVVPSSRLLARADAWPARKRTRSPRPNPGGPR